jgi:hypothetical protein
VKEGHGCDKEEEGSRQCQWHGFIYFPSLTSLYVLGEGRVGQAYLNMTVTQSWYPGEDGAGDGAVVFEDCADFVQVDVVLRTRSGTILARGEGRF